MYISEQADIDPRHPANWFEPKCHYDIVAKGRNIDRLTSEEFARAAIFNCEDYYGPELSLYRDEENGDRTCILSAEWDDGQQRYIEE